MRSVKRSVKRKVKVFGKSIPVLAIVAIVASAGMVSAALLSYYGKITGTVDVGQSVLVDGGNYLQSNTYDSNTVAGNTIVDGPHTLLNQADVPVMVTLNTSYSAENLDGTTMDPAGVTATYWKVSDTSRISIDGAIGEGEWDGAISFELVWDTDSKFGPTDHTVYVTTDDEYMYVAFDFAVTIGSDFVSFGTFKEGAFEHDTLIAPVIGWSYVVPSYLDAMGPLYDIIEDVDDDGLGFNDWRREEATYEWAADTATEMKVPLAELGLKIGDSFKASFGINVHHADPAGKEGYTYPEGAIPIDPLGTFTDLTIGTEISEDTPFELQPEETLNVYIVNEFDVALAPGTYTITTTVEPT